MENLFMVCGVEWLVAEEFVTEPLCLRLGCLVDFKSHIVFKSKRFSSPSFVTQEQHHLCQFSAGLSTLFFLLVRSLVLL